MNHPKSVPPRTGTHKNVRQPSLLLTQVISTFSSRYPSPQDTNITRVGDGGIELLIIPRSFSADRTGNTESSMEKSHAEVLQAAEQPRYLAM